MAHFVSHSSSGATTPDEWKVLGKEIADLVNQWAGRRDVVSRVGPDCGFPDGAPEEVTEDANRSKGATAFFSLSSAEVEINTDVSFGRYTTPDSIGSLKKKSNMYDFPKAIGAIYHESMHARFTGLDYWFNASKELTPSEQRALTVLEESRIERQGLSVHEDKRPFLRACIMDIVMEGLKESIEGLSETRAAAHLAALTLARISTKASLKRKDITATADKIESVLGPDLLKTLTKIWTEFHTIKDSDAGAERLYQLARDWDKAVQETAEERGEGSEGAGSASELMDELMEALGSSSGSISISVHRELGEQRADEMQKEQAAAAKEKADEKSKHKKTANSVFGIGPVTTHGQKTGSTLRQQRSPSSKERMAATRISKLLDKARYRDRDRTVLPSSTPPGRLRSSVAVQNAAYKAKGMMVESEPWKKVQRKHVDDPKFTMGVMVDISGSMTPAMEPMGVTAWVFSEACKKIQGTAASVYFGYSAFPTLRPGQKMDTVNIYDTPDGSHHFTEAMEALDGTLDLLYGTGVRLLVIVSDGHWEGGEVSSVTRWLDKLHKAGVGVLWLGWQTGDAAKDYCERSASARYIRVGQDVTDAAFEIGRAGADALTKAGVGR